MFSGNNATVKKNMKEQFFSWYFVTKTNIAMVTNITILTSFICNSHTLPVLFSSFVCFSKSLKKDFPSNVNLPSFK